MGEIHIEIVMISILPKAGIAVYLNCQKMGVENHIIGKSYASKEKYKN